MTVNNNSSECKKCGHANTKESPFKLKRRYCENCNSQLESKKNEMSDIRIPLKNIQRFIVSIVIVVFIGILYLSLSSLYGLKFEA
jgi:uncharacterized membrane protein YvbJ